MSENTNAIIPFTFMKVIEKSMESNAAYITTTERRNKDLEDKVEQLEKYISDQQVVIKQLEADRMSQTQAGMNIINLNDDEIMLLCAIINREKCIVPGQAVNTMKMNLVVQWQAVRDNWDTFITKNKAAAKEAADAAEAKRTDPIEEKKREAKRQKTAETKKLTAIMKETDPYVKRARMASHFGIELGS